MIMVIIITTIICMFHFPAKKCKEIQLFSSLLFDLCLLAFVVEMHAKPLNRAVLLCDLVVNFVR